MLAQILETETREAEAPAAGVLGAKALPAIGPRQTFARDEEIFGEGESADYIYKILDGVVRTCRFLGDGRRQIDEFHMAGEYFGFETGETHGRSAEAVGRPVTLLLIRRHTLNEIAARDAEVAGRLLGLTMSCLSRAQHHVAVLGRKSASERVAGFLLDFAERSGSTSFVDLPVTRQEIADYLGLTIETVSRTFSQFEADGLIGLPDRRRVLVRDPRRLRNCCA